MKLVKCSILVLSFVLTACAGTITTEVKPELNSMEISKALIVSSADSKYIRFEFPKTVLGLPDSEAVTTEKRGNTAEVIQGELKKYGVQSVIASPGENQENIDIIVKYTDTWRWDIKYILDELIIYIVKPESNEVIAESKYKIGNREFHDFPSPEREIPSMIKEIMADKTANKQ